MFSSRDGSGSLNRDNAFHCRTIFLDWTPEKIRDVIQNLEQKTGLQAGKLNTPPSWRPEISVYDFSL